MTNVNYDRAARPPGIFRITRLSDDQRALSHKIEHPVSKWRSAARPPNAMAYIRSRLFPAQ
jgi:hypothetical protein